MKLDVIDLMMTDYHTALNDRVREAYLAAYAVLERTHLARTSICTDYIEEAVNDEEFSDANCDLSFENDRWSDQTEALAAMALTMIASTNKSFLDGIKRLFEKAYPSHPRGYQAPSQLERRIAEYRSRFGIDLETITSFDTIREIELARNCCVHEDGKVTNDYVTQTRKRMARENGPASTMPKGTPGFDIITRTHVEGHAAAFMQQEAITNGTLYINNPTVCESCTRLLPRMLDEGSRLNVVLPDGSVILFAGRVR